MTNTNIVNAAFLEALLAHPDPAQRQAAEHLWNTTLSSSQQAQQLLAALPGLGAPHQAWAALLLRRSLLRLDHANEVEQMVAQLWDLFTSTTTSTTTTTTSLRHLGDAVAAGTSILGLLDRPKGMAAVQPMVAALPEMMKSSNSARAAIDLAISLVEDAPRLVWEACGPATLAALLQSAIATASSNVETSTLVRLVVATAQTSVATATNQKGVETTLADNLHNPHSLTRLAAQQCLVPLLQQMVAASNNTQTIDSTVWEYLLQAADHVPSLLWAAQPALAQASGRILEQAAAQPDHDALPVVAVWVSLVAHRHCRSLLTADLAQSLVPIFTRALLQALVRDPPDLDDDDDVPLCLSLEEGSDHDDLPTSFAQELLFDWVHALGEPVWQSLQSVVHELPVLAQLQALILCVEAAPLALAPHATALTQTALAQAQTGFGVGQFHALQLVGVLAESYPQALQQQQAQVVECLRQAIQNMPHVKITAMACRGVGSICRDAENTAVNGTEPLWAALLQGPLAHPRTSRDVIVCQVYAVQALASLARAAPEALVTQAAVVLPGLWGLSQQESTEHAWESARLQGTAVQVATLLGQIMADSESPALQPAREAFAVDAVNFMQWTMPILQHNSPTSIPLDMLLSACARIATVLGPAYAPYAMAVLPQLLARATAATDVEFQQADENAHDDDDDDGAAVTVTIPGRGRTRVSVNTTQIQEKAQAVRALYEHAVALPDFPHMEQYMEKLLSDLLVFPYSSEVRSTAAQTLAALFASAMEHAQSAGELGPARGLPVMAQAMAEQIDALDGHEHEALYAMADALSEVLYHVHTFVRGNDAGRAAVLSHWSLAQVEAVVQLVSGSMKSCLDRRQQLGQALTVPLGPDERAHVVAELQHEESLLTPLVDSVGYLLKLARHDFVPIFERCVVPILGPSLTGTDGRARHAAVCLWDDCVEHCGSAAAAQAAPMLVQGVRRGLDSATNEDDEELVQSSLYGVAQMARYAPRAILEPHLPEILPRILALASNSELENRAVYENSVSALATLTLFGPEPPVPCDPNTVIPLILQALPLEEDPDEAQYCHAGFCQLLEQQDSRLAPHAAACGRILQALQEIDDEDYVALDTRRRISALMGQPQSAPALDVARAPGGAVVTP